MGSPLQSTASCSCRSDVHEGKPNIKNQGRQFYLSALVAFRISGLHQKIPHKGFCSSFRSASRRATSSTEESIITNRRPLVNFTSGKTSTVCTVSRPLRRTGRNLMNFQRQRYQITPPHASVKFNYLKCRKRIALGEIYGTIVAATRRCANDDSRCCKSS